ncbi:uncharacterized protein PAC_01244 [Phialocephala subalpina]|uniref:Uncharacterized protein n=1 Tax=Phialocephala subalpina TaxID=576137 RepID=A0A1L7WF58_9HELO|nr:uncharacterized protein PAC_01244 [Phialocephala subalpina]
MPAQQYSGQLPKGMPNGMNQITQAQFNAMRGGQMARPVNSVNLPQHLQQQQQQAEHSLQQQVHQQQQQQQPGRRGKNVAWGHMRNLPGGKRPNDFTNSVPTPGGRTLGAFKISKAPQLSMPSSTISKDNTAGDRARRAALLAEYGQRQQRGQAGSSRSTMGTRFERTGTMDDLNRTTEVSDEDGAFMTTDDHKTHNMPPLSTQTSNGSDNQVYSGSGAFPSDGAFDISAVPVGSMAPFRLSHSSSDLQGLQRSFNTPFPLSMNFGNLSQPSQSTSATMTPRNMSRQTSPSASSGPTNLETEKSQWIEPFKFHEWYDFCCAIAFHSEPYKLPTPNRTAIWAGFCGSCECSTANEPGLQLKLIPVLVRFYFPLENGDIGEIYEQYSTPPEEFGGFCEHRGVCVSFNDARHDMNSDSPAFVDVMGTYMCVVDLTLCEEEEKSLEEQKRSELV